MAAVASNLDRRRTPYRRSLAPLLLRSLRIGTMLLARPYRHTAGPCLVLAPHADDETLGCGALIARKRATGVAVVVAIATDCAGSDRFGRSAASVSAVRRQEALDACLTLGVEPPDVRFFGLPDGELADHQEVLISRLTTLAASVRPAEVFVCSTLDGHPDHVALRQASLAAELGDSAVYEYLVWAWSRWPAIVRERFRRAPNRRGGARHLLELLFSLRRSRSGRFLDRKAEALRCYESQVGDGRPGRGVPQNMMKAHLGRFELLIACRAEQDALAPFS